MSSQDDSTAMGETNPLSPSPTLDGHASGDSELIAAGLEPERDAALH